MLTDITLPSIESICYRMREQDRIEVFGVRPHDNAYRLAWEVHAVILNQGRGRIAWHDGRPAALMAFTENWPGMWDAWAFGTNDFKSVFVELVGWGRREARSILTVCKGHRLQCDSRVGHDDAHKMIRALGGKAEGQAMRGYGKDGADYQRFVWLRSEDAAVLAPGFIRAA